MAEVTAGSNSSAVTISDLPNEVLEHIMYFLLPYDDLNQCQSVSKRWKRVVQSVITHGKIGFSKAIKTFSIQWDDDRQPSSVITKRYSHSACCHGNSMYVFGGCTCASTTFNDLWRLDLSTRTWHRLLTMGSYPCPKACASLVYYNNSLILFGGWTHPSPYPLHQAWRTFNELHIYDIEANRWSAVPSPTLAPPSLAGHTATVHNDCMIVFGGLLGHSGGSNDVWCFNIKNLTWSKKETTENKPHPRYGHSQIAIDSHHLLIIGGWGGLPNMMLNDIFMLIMTGSVWTWSAIVVNNTQWSASHLYCHPACKVDDNYVVVLSRNPQSTPTPLAYSRWASNSHIGGNGNNTNRRVDIDHRSPDVTRKQLRDRLSNVVPLLNVSPPFYSLPPNKASTKSPFLLECSSKEKSLCIDMHVTILELLNLGPSCDPVCVGCPTESLNSTIKTKLNFISLVMIFLLIVYEITKIDF